MPRPKNFARSILRCDDSVSFLEGTNDFHDAFVGNLSINLSVLVRQSFAIADHIRSGAANADSSVL